MNIPLRDHSDIAELRDVLSKTLKPEGVEIWLRNAEVQGWDFDKAMRLAQALLGGDYA